MKHYKNFTELELKEIIVKLKIKYENNDPIIRKFVHEVHKLNKKGKSQNIIQTFKELIIRVIAEFLKRMAIP